MKRLSHFAILTVALAGASGVLSASAQTGLTEPAGLVNITVPATGDFWFSPPLTNAPVFTGQVGAVSGNVVTISQAGGPPAWTPNQFVYAQGSQSCTITCC